MPLTELQNEKEFTPCNELTVSNVDYSWNIIEEDDFRERVRTIFRIVSGALTKTLGPYGSTTIIEEYGENHVTKDGWTVLKHIHFKDNVNNDILHLLTRISAQVIIKVGDGSTSSIVAANKILEVFEDNAEVFDQVRPKDFITLLNQVVTTIADRIYKNATPIDKEAFKEIYNLAYVSTNGDSFVSSIIRDIYKVTDNPSIEYRQAKSSETTYEIVDGYKMDNMTYLDQIFANSDDGTCTIEKPYILMFNHKLDIETSKPIIQKALERTMAENRRLVVIAPYYDNFFLDSIRQEINLQYRAMNTSYVVYLKASLINNIFHEMYNDFAVMTGAEVFREQQIYEIKLNEPDCLDLYLGEVDNIIINNRTTTIKGFFKMNPNSYSVVYKDATAKYNKLIEDSASRDIVDTKIYEQKKRLSKLKGKMGIINVGGNSTLELKANYDLVEDAVKACESAYHYGYNCGGNLVIPFVIRQILEEDKSNETKMSDITKSVYLLISEAFQNVFATVLDNGYNYDDKSAYYEIINSCISSNELWCYDLTTRDFSKNIINSCITDIEILKATVSIISLLLSSNQYISIEPETTPRY